MIEDTALNHYFVDLLDISGGMDPLSSSVTTASMPDRSIILTNQDDKEEQLPRTTQSVPHDEYIDAKNEGSCCAEKKVQQEQKQQRRKQPLPAGVLGTPHSSGTVLDMSNIVSPAYKAILLCDNAKPTGTQSTPISPCNGIESAHRPSTTIVDSLTVAASLTDEDVGNDDILPNLSPSDVHKDSSMESTLPPVLPLTSPIIASTKDLNRVETCTKKPSSASSAESSSRGRNKGERRGRSHTRPQRVYRSKSASAAMPRRSRSSMSTSAAASSLQNNSSRRMLKAPASCRPSRKQRAGLPAHSPSRRRSRTLQLEMSLSQSLHGPESIDQKSITNIRRKSEGKDTLLSAIKQHPRNGIERRQRASTGSRPSSQISPKTKGNKDKVLSAIKQHPRYESERRRRASISARPSSPVTTKSLMKRASETAISLDHSLSILDLIASKSNSAAPSPQTSASCDLVLSSAVAIENDNSTLCTENGERITLIIDSQGTIHQSLKAPRQKVASRQQRRRSRSKQTRRGSTIEGSANLESLISSDSSSINNANTSGCGSSTSPTLLLSAPFCQPEENTLHSKTKKDGDVQMSLSALLSQPSSPKASVSKSRTGRSSMRNQLRRRSKSSSSSRGSVSKSQTEKPSSLSHRRDVLSRSIHAPIRTRSSASTGYACQAKSPSRRTPAKTRSRIMMNSTDSTTSINNKEHRSSIRKQHRTRSSSLPRRKSNLSHTSHAEKTISTEVVENRSRGKDVVVASSGESTVNPPEDSKAKTIVKSNSSSCKADTPPKIERRRTTGESTTDSGGAKTDSMPSLQRRRTTGSKPNNLLEKTEQLLESAKEVVAKHIVEKKEIKDLAPKESNDESDEDDSDDDDFNKKPSDFLQLGIPLAPPLYSNALDHRSEIPSSPSAVRRVSGKSQPTHPGSACLLTPKKKVSRGLSKALSISTLSLNPDSPPASKIVKTPSRMTRLFTKSPKIVRNFLPPLAHACHNKM